MAVPKRKMSRSATRSRKSANMRLAPRRALAVPELRSVAAPAHGVQQLRLVPRPAGPRRRVDRGERGDRRDRAPARDRDRRDGRRPRARGDRRGRVSRPSTSSTSTSCSSDRPTRSRAPARTAARPPRVEVLPGARSHRDGRRARDRGPHQEGLVARARAPKRCATGGPTRWSAPATPAPRWPPRCCGCGRIRGVHRPAIAVPLPVFGERARSQLLVDGGATVDPEPEWLVEWAVLGRAYARVRLGVDEPTIALLSNGEEAGQGRRAAQARRRRCSPT